MKTKICHRMKTLFFFLVLLLIGVNADCNSPIFRKNTIQKETFIGIWSLTASSEDFFRKENICCLNKKLELILREDNSFELINMPDCWVNSFGECSGEVNTYKGNWKLWRPNENSDYLLMLDYGNETSSMSVINQNQIKLVFSFGDPDSGRIFYLVKEKTQK